MRHSQEETKKESTNKVQDVHNVCRMNNNECRTCNKRVINVEYVCRTCNKECFNVEDVRKNRTTVGKVRKDLQELK